MVQCTLYNVHCTILAIINRNLIDPRTEIQLSAWHVKFPLIVVSTIEVLCFNYRKTIYVSMDSRNWKHAYAYVMLTDHMPNSNDVAQKPSNFYIFFFMQRINYIFIKKETLTKFV